MKPMSKEVIQDVYVVAIDGLRFLKICYSLLTLMYSKQFISKILLHMVHLVFVEDWSLVENSCSFFPA